MKWSELLFGNSVIALRLPNILFFLMYMWFCFKILLNLKQPFLVVPGFILLTMNPFLLDMYGLARGYAMGISIMIGSIYFNLKYFRTEKNVHYLLSLILGGVSVLANFTFVYYLLVLLFMHQILIFFSFGKENIKVSFGNYFWKKNKVTAIFLPVYALIMYEPFRRLLKLTIDFGGFVGLWKDTVLPLLHYYSPEKNSLLFAWMLKLLLFFTIIGILLYFLKMVFKRNGSTLLESKTNSFIFIVFTGIILETVLQHHLRGVPYLSDRFALFLIPLFWLCFIFLIDKINLKITIIPILFICGYLGYNAVDCYTPYYYYIWKQDSTNDEVVARIEKEVKKNNRKLVQVGISWILEPGLNYVRIKDDLIWLKPFNRNRFNVDDDYCYVLDDDRDWIPDSSRYRLLEKFPLSNASLYEVIAVK